MPINLHSSDPSKINLAESSSKTYSVQFDTPEAGKETITLVDAADYKAHQHDGHCTCTFSWYWSSYLLYPFQLVVATGQETIGVHIHVHIGIKKDRAHFQRVDISKCKVLCYYDAGVI